MVMTSMASWSLALFSSTLLALLLPHNLHPVSCCPDNYLFAPCHASSGVSQGSIIAPPPFHSLSTLTISPGFLSLLLPLSLAMQMTSLSLSLPVSSASSHQAVQSDLNIISSCLSSGPTFSQLMQKYD